VTNQSPTISRNGFVFKLPQGWEVDEIGSEEGQILFERNYDNEDTGLAGMTIKKITTNQSRDSLLKTEDAECMKSTTMNTVASEKTINQFAGIRGIGIKKSGTHKDKDGSIPIEYLLFATDSDSHLPNCLILVLRACDRKWGTMKDIDYIVHNAHSENK
jgi:hypothetical protein